MTIILIFNRKEEAQICFGYEITFDL